MKHLRIFLDSLIKYWVKNIVLNTDEHIKHNAEEHRPVEKLNERFLGNWIGEAALLKGLRGHFLCVDI